MGRLLEQTEHAVVILDNFNDYYDPRMKRANAVLFEGEPRVSLVEDDFCDPLLCEALFDRCRFSHVIHLGAYPGVPYSLKEPKLYIDGNIAGTAVLLDTARRHKVERFLFASSSTVYGRGAQSPFVEDAPLGIPASPYGLWAWRNSHSMNPGLRCASAWADIARTVGATEGPTK